MLYKNLFYTERGAGKTVQIDEATIQKIVQAFEAVQIKEGLLPKEA